MNGNLFFFILTTPMINDHKVNYATELSVGEGIIGFQSETTEIFYRNIFIKELLEDMLSKQVRVK